MASDQDRVRVTISLSQEIAKRIDATIDGMRIRNRSHAIETLVTESLQIAQVRSAIIMAGGDQATRRLPAIRHMLDTLVKSGIFEVTIAVGYLGDKIRESLGDGHTLGIRINYIQSDLGTGGALLQMKNRLKHTFIVVNVQDPVDVDIQNLLKFHREHQPLVTIATRSLSELSGIYVMEPKVLQHIPTGFCMLEDTVFHELTKKGKLLPYPILKDAKE